MVAAGWDVASHGYRWINYQHVTESVEREHMQQAIDIHTRLTGSRPPGWYTSRTSPNTARLVAENGGFVYDADSYADDLPYREERDVGGTTRSQLVVPYTLDVNDMRFATPQGFNSGDRFFAYLRDTLDYLYAEGGKAPKMMSIGLHCRIAGRPGRAAALARVLGHIQSHSGV